MDTITAARTATLSRPPPTLLREWSYDATFHNNGGSSHTNNGDCHGSTNIHNINGDPGLMTSATARATAATATRNSSGETIAAASSSLEETTVPVAPAVVLPSSSRNEEKERRYNYPVATFVSNLVRQYGVEPFTTSVLASFGTDASQHHSATLDTPSTTSILSQNSQPVNVQQQNIETHAVQTPRYQQSNRPTLEEAEYLLVDGDLILVPSRTQTETITTTINNSLAATNNQRSDLVIPGSTSSDQDMIRQPHDQDGGRKQKFKLKQRLRGIRKWIKKRATRLVNDDPITMPPPPTSLDQHVTTATSVVEPVTNLTLQRPVNPLLSSGSLRNSGPFNSSSMTAETVRRRSTSAQRRRTWSINRHEPSVLDEMGPQLTSAAVASRSAPFDAYSESFVALPHGPMVSSLHQQQHQHQHHADALASSSHEQLADHFVDPMLAPNIIDEGTILSSDYNTPDAAVNALFVGNIEQVLESGVLTNVASAVAFVESDKNDDFNWYKKDNEKMVQAEITLDSMLQLARHESSSEEDETFDFNNTALHSSSSLKTPPPQSKFDEYSTDHHHTKPLSEATTLDANVWNDTLKVVLVGSGGVAVDKSALGRALAGKRPKRPKQLQHQAHSYYSQLGVDVHTWTCSPDALRFTLWDVYSYHSAGNHPATQSLFFSSNTLYLLLWDLGVGTISKSMVTATKASTKHSITSLRRSYRRSIVRQDHDYDQDDDEDDDDDWDEDEDDDFMREELSRATDRALELDISDNVLTWLDPMAFRGTAILPVVLVPSDASSSSLSCNENTIMTPAEVQRRCAMLQMLLMKHPVFEGDGAPRLIFGDNDSIVRVVMETGEGVPELQEMIHAIAKEKVFPHIQTAVDPIVVEVNQTIRRLKKDHKVILLDHLLSEVKSRLDVEQVQDALFYLSNVGEVLYYGNSTDEILSRYVILSRKWLVSALSCILRPDLQRELDETRRFMNLQCVYSGEAFCESDVVQTLIRGTNSSCPILSAKDSAMLWKSMSFMREAADRTVQLSQASNTMYDFLERLLVYTGIFMPFTVSSEPTYFVPSLLDTAAAPGVWTFKSSESWMTTLCHSWLLRDGAPSNIMEHVTTCLLQDLYEFSHTFQGETVKPIHNAKMYPLGANSMNEFLALHNQEPIGRIKIHQVVCWKSCLLVKIGTVFADADQAELRESFTEIFVALVDEQSEYCVSTRNMSSSMKRLLVCGKGQVGHNGRKLWQGGFSLVLDSLKASLADATGCHREVVCPECLAHAHPSVAGVWSWDTVQAANETGNAGVRCTRGHLVDTNLLCGVHRSSAKLHAAEAHIPSHPRPRKPVCKLLNSVVVVALWDAYAREIRSVGTGFIVDKKLGLIVTAAHILFDMTPGRKFGTPYFGFPSAKAVVGVIDADGHHKAVFRYFAEIVSHDIRNVDACVIRVTTKLERDVDGVDCGGQLEIPLNGNMKNERFPQLKMTRTFELEESVRILGFNQGGEGILEQGRHVNRSADFAKGYICKRFTNIGSDDSSTSSKGSSSSSTSLSVDGKGIGSNKDSLRSSSNSNGRVVGDSFVPREEIVVMCPTISGHSGGPCVNDEGRVVGILSRADPVDRQRCYLVPTSEIKVLVNEAKEILRSFPS